MVILDTYWRGHYIAEAKIRDFLSTFCCLCGEAPRPKAGCFCLCGGVLDGVLLSSSKLTIRSRYLSSQLVTTVVVATIVALVIGSLKTLYKEITW